MSSIASRLAVAYAASGCVSAAVSYFRGRRGLDLVRDTAVHGFVLGTVGAAGYEGYQYFYGDSDDDDYSEDTIEARHNGLLGSSNVKDDMGTLSAEGVKLLSRVNSDDLFSDQRGPGIKVEDVPDNPAVVNQE